jgi:hypothetical protein
VSKTSSFEECSLSMFIRSIHYVKIVYQPGERLEAKAYLAGNHHWHTPASKTEDPEEDRSSAA